jgi:hypothetical protein
MKDYTKNYPGRAMRVVWVPPGKQVQAFDCSTELDLDPKPFEYVWIPEEGYSVNIKQTFDTKKQARSRAINDLVSEISQAQHKLDALLRAVEKEG